MAPIDHVISMREVRNVYSISVGMCQGKRPYKRPGHGWENNIKMKI
jgi:hypothetical protein